MSLYFMVSVVLQIGMNHVNSSENPTGMRMAVSLGKSTEDSCINYIFLFPVFYDAPIS